MIDVKLEVLRHVEMCARIAVIKGPRGLASLNTIVASVQIEGVRDAVRDLHKGGFIEVRQPHRPKSLLRFVLTEKGAAVVNGRIAV